MLRILYTPERPHDDRWGDPAVNDLARELWRKVELRKQEIRLGYPAFLLHPGTTEYACHMIGTGMHKQIYHFLSSLVTIIMYSAK